jgi:hypothetical protein
MVRCFKDRGQITRIADMPGQYHSGNNFLQTSRAHKDKVFDMLRTQRGICFKGGLQCDLIDDHFINAVTSLRIKELWIACDTDEAIPNFKRAAEKLTKAGFNQNKIYCYALIGDDMNRNEARLREIYNAGAMPFAQLYQPLQDTKIKYDAAWNKFHRMWSRPAAIRAYMERGTNMWDFNT